MYVCICNALRERDVRRVAPGCGNAAQVYRALGCATSDGKDMLKAQIALIAGFAAGLPAGTPLGG